MRETLSWVCLKHTAHRTLFFNKHVSSLCKKAGRKLTVLARFSSYMTLTLKGVLMKSFIESQFGY